MKVNMCLIPGWLLFVTLPERFHLEPLHLYFSLGSEDLFLCELQYTVTDLWVFSV